jgi:3-oxoacyl-[acyl-carrier protein] reductase
MSLTGKVALVTGSAKGIGQAVALALAREGADVAVNYSRSKAEAEAIRDLIKAMGRKTVVVKADVSRKDRVARMVETVRTKLGDIDILVNNAGIVNSGKIENIPEAEWDRVFAVNLKGTFLCCQTVLPFMKQRKSGTIVNISSVSAKIGGINSAASYAASKAGVSCFTIQLAKEALPFHIRVNAVAPGAIDTALLDVYGPGARDRLEKGTPLGLGKPEDIAEAVVFLVSDRARYITGEILDVNGGIVMD